jgi:hypothetical protein
MATRPSQGSLRMAVKSRNPNRDLQTEPRAQRASKSNNPDASKPIFTAKSQPFPQISDLKQAENPVCNSQGLVTAIDWRRLQISDRDRTADKKCFRGIRNLGDCCRFKVRQEIAGELRKLLKIWSAAGFQPATHA